MPDLPPDLERLGEVLTQATASEVAGRRHRVELSRRLVACLAAAILVFVAMAPSRLGSGTSGGGLPMALVPGVAGAQGDLLGGPCDRAHGGPGEYFQVPEGCVIQRPAPQAR